MEPTKRELVLKRLGDKKPALPKPPFVMPTVVPEVYTIHNVPFFPQLNMHWSGAAALQIISTFYGRPTEQEVIAQLAAIEPYPAYGTETWRENARRVASILGFNAMSYYPFRYLSLDEIVANETDVSKRDQCILKSIIANNQPVFVRLREVREGKIISLDVNKFLSMVGHAVVVVGYDQEYVFIHDPWNVEAWGGQGGPNSKLSWQKFADLWVDGCLDYMLVIQPAVTIDIDTIPTYCQDKEPLDLPVRFTYLVPEPFLPWAPIYRNPLAHLEIAAKNGLSLRTGQHSTKKLGDVMLPGTNLSIRWGLHAEDLTIKRKITVTFEAIVDEPNAPFPYTSKVWQQSTVVLS